MKLLDRIWSMLGLVEAEETDEPQQSSEKPPVRLERKPDRLPRNAEDNKTRRIIPSEPVPVSTGSSLGVRTAATSQIASDFDGNSGKVVITQPMGFDDARQIAENLTNGKTVFVNFERADGDTIKRTVDFMSGITYAVGGTVQRISSVIFLFAPARVEVFANERYTEEDQSALPWRRV